MNGAGLPGMPMVSSTLPSGVHFLDGVVAVVGAVEIVVGVDVQAVRTREQPLAPALEEVALAVEHHHRVLATIEHVDVVLAVDRDRADVGQVPALGELSPVLHHPIAMFAGPQNGHASPPRFASRCGDCRKCKRPAREGLSRGGPAPREGRRRYAGRQNSETPPEQQRGLPNQCVIRTNANLSLILLKSVEVFRPHLPQTRCENLNQKSPAANRGSFASGNAGGVSRAPGSRLSRPDDERRSGLQLTTTATFNVDVIHVVSSD